MPVSLPSTKFHWEKQLVTDRLQGCLETRNESDLAVDLSRCHFAIAASGNLALREKVIGLSLPKIRLEAVAFVELSRRQSCSDDEVYFCERFFKMFSNDHVGLQLVADGVAAAYRQQELAVSHESTEAILAMGFGKSKRELLLAAKAGCQFFLREQACITDPLCELVLREPSSLPLVNEVVSRLSRLTELRSANEVKQEVEGIWLLIRGINQRYGVGRRTNALYHLCRLAIGLEKLCEINSKAKTAEDKLHEKMQAPDTFAVFGALLNSQSARSVLLQEQFELWLQKISQDYIKQERGGDYQIGERENVAELYLGWVAKAYLDSFDVVFNKVMSTLEFSQMFPHLHGFCCSLREVATNPHNPVAVIEANQQVRDGLVSQSEQPRNWVVSGSLTDYADAPSPVLIDLALSCLTLSLVVHDDSALAKLYWQLSWWLTYKASLCEEQSGGLIHNVTARMTALLTTADGSQLQNKTLSHADYWREKVLPGLQGSTETYQDALAALKRYGVACQYIAGDSSREVLPISRMAK